MILAQVTPHANSLFHEWGLIVAAWGLCATLLAGVWWLLKLKSEETSASALKIRSSLAGLMERTFHIEALKVFELIEAQLPFALSQVRDENPQRSAFDMLCMDLRKINPDEPDRDEYRNLLKLALASIISDEAKKLLGGPTPTGLRFSFRHETERILAHIAEQTTRSRKKERTYEKETSRTTVLFIIATIGALLATPWVMFDATWAFYVGVICLSVFLLACGMGLISLLRLTVCQKWLTKRARWGPDDWVDDMDRSS